jgi:predicted phage terminase large subunit-like protein
MDCRLIIEDEFYQAMFPATRLSDDQNEKVKYVTTARGHRLATSVGGSLTGEGAKRLIFDDLLKPDEAPSDAVRRSTNDWMTQTFLNRLDDKRVGTIVGVMQRVHQDDPCGLLLEAGGWEHLNMPAIFNKRQVFMVGGKEWVREAGEYLDPERLNAEVLAQELKNMGEYAFAGQYMQNPAPAEGGMVKWDWFKFYEDRPVGFDAVIHTWDTAIKSAAESDYSVGMVWGIRWDGYYLLEIVRKKLKYPELKAEVRRLYERDLPRYILVEDKASGQQLLQDYGAQRNIPMIGIVPIRDKVTRLSVVTDVIETGKVFLPKDAPWLDAFREELRVFPNGKHDDQIDCLSQFLGWAKINFDRLVENVNMFQAQEEYFGEDMDFGYGRSEISGY